MKVHILEPGCAKGTQPGATVTPVTGELVLGRGIEKASDRNRIIFRVIARGGVFFHNQEKHVKSLFAGNTIKMLIVIGCLSLLPATGVFATGNGEAAQVPVSGMVTVAELGSTSCLPCKLMLPIMEELKKEYKDRVAIVFVDVMEHPGAAQKFEIMAIPTQIFFDADGKEAIRHVGFMEKAAIVAELEKLGVK